MPADPAPAVTVGSEELQATFLPGAGARLHRLVAFGHDLLRTPADPGQHHVEPFLWGGYHMVPWCNRVAAGPVPVGDRTVDLAADFPDGTAIHGQAYLAPWQHDGAGRFRFAGGGDAWPWPYAVTVDAVASGPTLSLTYRLRNDADDPMPAGLGIHPWYRPPSRLTIPGRSVFPDNTWTEPDPEPVHGDLDLRHGPRPALDLDACWVDLTAPRYHLVWDDLGVELAVEADDPDAVVVAANPAALGATAVELQTHAPNGLRRLRHGEPHPMTFLAPGATRTLTISFTVARTGPAPS